eukprot:3060848-Rhodomonas_salina.2
MHIKQKTAEPDGRAAGVGQRHEVADAFRGLQGLAAERLCWPAPSPCPCAPFSPRRCTVASMLVR